VTDTDFRLGYRPALDGIRAFAVIAVMANHLNGMPFAEGGGIGVDVFFTLSGILISTLIIEEWARSGRVDLGAFYVRRALRLLPALFALLLALLGLLVLASIITVPGREGWSLSEVDWLGAFPAAAFYVSNWVGDFALFPLGPLEHTWSLANEEQFYLLWPPILVLLLKRDVNRRALALGLTGLALLFALESGGRHGLDDGPNTYGLDGHADALLIGCALALLATEGVLTPFANRPLLLRAAAAVGAVALVILVVVPGPDLPVSRFWRGLVTGLSTAAVITYVLTLERGIGQALLSQRHVVWLGRISYGVYLWHYPIFYFINAREPAGWVVQIVLALAVAATSYYVVERPAQALKNRRFRRLPEGAPA
jgi:peptidoglycan/LPS O-acetylase OafA/YrhL